VCAVTLYTPLRPINFPINGTIWYRVIRVLEKLNTPRTVIVVLAFVVVVNGFLLYLYRQDLAKPPAAPPIKPAATLPMKPVAAAPPPSCSASEVDFLGYSDALDGYSYEGLPVGGALRACLWC
jgi:hypothetical protein